MAELVDLASARDVAEALDINRAGAYKIIRSGLAGSVYRASDGEYVARENLEKIAARDFVTGRALVVSVGPWQPECDPLGNRDGLGWKIPPEVRAISGYWRVRDPGAHSRFVVVVATVVASVYKIQDWERTSRGVLFDLEEMPGDPFQGKRIATPRGNAAFVLQ